MSETTDHPLTANGFDFRVRLYPAAEPNGSTLVWLHGGAFLFGTIEMPEADEIAKRLSAAGTTVVSVDYTLGPVDALPPLPPRRDGEAGPDPEQVAAELAAAGPRSPYPTASLQTVEAFRWATEHASDWGGDAEQVSLGGASAGGNLSAGATVRLRDGGDALPACLVLVYPVLHATLPPMDDELAGFLRGLPGGGGLPPEAGQAINDVYLAGASPMEVYAFPGGHDMRGMPRTLILTAEFDGLRPSAEAFAADLVRGGVDVRVVRERGAAHGDLNEIGDPSAEHTLSLIAGALSD